MKSTKLIYVVVVVLAVIGAVYFYSVPATKESEPYKEFMSSGRDFLKDGNYEEARVSFEQALELNKEDALTYVGLYNANLGLKDYEAAKTAILGALDIINYVGAYWINLAELEWQKLDSPEINVRAVYLAGIEATKQAADVGNRIDVHTNYSAYLAAIEDYAGAIEQLEIAKELNPDRADIYDGEIEWLRGRM